LIVNSLVGAAGSSTLSSDVVTAGSINNDLGSVTFDLAMKDPGSVGSPSGPTSANYITITQYHVKYVRTDGHNVEGVDVPYAFDGGMGVTVNGTGVSSTFTIVRNIAKNEAPLKALTVNGLVISTIAQVTFYGHDQTGREVSATANLSIDFANFADQS
jgi:hypothetical protein